MVVVEQAEAVIQSVKIREVKNRSDDEKRTERLLKQWQ